MDLRVLALAAACTLTYCVGSGMEKLNTNKVEQRFSDYREQSLKVNIAAISRVQEQRDEQDKRRTTAEAKLHKVSVLVAAQRTELADYSNRLARLRAQAGSGSAVPDVQITTAPGLVGSAPANGQFPAALGEAALALMPEADEYLLRLRECKAFVDAVETAFPAE